MHDHVLRYLTNTIPDWDEDEQLQIRSPGRINIIGEHVDYTGGLVMPASIDRSVDFAVRKLDEAEWRLHAVDIGETCTLTLPLEGGKTGKLWVDYLKGIGVQFQDEGNFLPGMEIVFGGNLPRGAGMSSSAALEGGMAFILNELLNTKLSRPDLAALCQRSSNTFLGIPTGIMDQYASLNGHAGGPIVINCSTVTSEPVKNSLTDFRFILVNSMVSHDLSDGAYGRRVEECARALAAIQQSSPEVTHLSGATQEDLDEVAATLDPVIRKRASYVIAENARVVDAITAIEAGSSHELGRLLNATHAGLREDYEVSCEEIDYLQRLATETEGVAGARLMGGGFGGCTINLVADDSAEAFTHTIISGYSSKYGIEPEVYPVRLNQGTHQL